MPPHQLVLFLLVPPAQHSTTTITSMLLLPHSIILLVCHNYSCWHSYDCCHSYWAFIFHMIVATTLLVLLRPWCYPPHPQHVNVINCSCSSSSCINPLSYQLVWQYQNHNQLWALDFVSHDHTPPPLSRSLITHHASTVLRIQALLSTHCHCELVLTRSPHHPPLPLRALRITGNRGWKWKWRRWALIYSFSITNVTGEPPFTLRPTSAVWFIAFFILSCGHSNDQWGQEWWEGGGDNDENTLRIRITGENILVGTKQTSHPHIIYDSSLNDYYCTNQR